MDIKKEIQIAQQLNKLWSIQAMAHTHSNEMDKMHCSYSLHG